MSKLVKKNAFSTVQLKSLGDQLTEYAKQDWPECPGLTLEFNYLTRLYMLSVKGTKHSRAFSMKAVVEICGGARDPSYAIRDLQESVTAAQ